MLKKKKSGEIEKQNLRTHRHEKNGKKRYSKNQSKKGEKCIGIQKRGKNASRNKAILHLVAFPLLLFRFLLQPTKNSDQY